MKTISRSQYWQLLGLRTAIGVQRKIDDAMQKAAQQITGELDHSGNPELTGHTYDIMCGSRELEDGLQIMGITVVDDPPSP